MSNNTRLPYPVIIKYGESMYVAPMCEVFLDKHSIQWVKFFPKNGPNINREHMIRTSEVVIVRRDTEADQTEDRERALGERV